MKVIVSTDGITLERIAAREWGDWTLWPLIRDANPGLLEQFGPDWPARIPTGLSLVIPDPPTAARTRRVQSGDSWSSIAAEAYGSEHFSRVIAGANGFRACRELVGLDCRIPALADPAKIRRERVI